MPTSDALVRSARLEACAVTDERCPHCDAGREPAQRYCVECGQRLPVVTGAVPALRRRWLRRFGWYPGDWIWLALPALVVALAGAAVSIAIDRRGSGSAAATTVPPSLARGATAAAGGQPVVVASAAGKRAAPGGAVWPAVGSGWTVLLASYPATRGEAAPRAAARRAARAGLPDVGVLDSSQFSSLHPGYLVVFSGIYTASTDADTALRTARARGFGSAYSREISR